jgi:hypothetical protein
MRDLRRGRQTPEGIAHAREAQAESLQRFVEGIGSYLLLCRREIILGGLASGSPSRFP